MQPILLACGLLLTVLTGPLAAREWRDATGKYSVEADLIASSEDRVVLKRKDDKLIAVETAQLSAADKEYLASQEGAKLGEAGELQTWTLRRGWKVVGRVVGYGRKEVVIQRRRGRIFVNDRLLNNLPEVYQYMLPRIVSHFEQIELEDARDFTNWVVAQRGEPRKYVVDGVMLELENGDEYAIPFIFFGPEDLKVLQPGWERWLAVHEDAVRRQQEDLYLRAQAEAYQQDRRFNQQIAGLQLLLMAVDVGVVDLWEVYLEPAAGVAAPPLVVVVPARNSQQAIDQALSRNPRYVLGAARRLN